MNSLPIRKHPRHDAWFTELSLGSSSWSRQDGPDGDYAARAVIERAWQAGIRYFDTAPYYGSGLCERRLGAGLVWKRRPDYLLSTKVGIDLDPFGRGTAVARHYPFHADFQPRCDYSHDGIWRSFETSLHRLGIPSSDIAFMHGLSICEGGMEDALKTGMPSLIALREAGYTRMVGVGANTPEIAMAFIERFDLDVLLFAGGFSLTDHSGAGPVIAECGRRGIAVIAASPFASGRYFSDDNAEFRRTLEAICRDFGISETAALLQFGLRYEAVVSVLWSTTKSANVENTVSAFREKIPEPFWEAFASAVQSTAA